MNYYSDQITNDIELKSSLNIAIDCGNGAASIITKQIYEQLGCKVTSLFDELDGNFPNHHPDPTIDSNLFSLIKKVRKTKSEIGIALDGDADRIILCDEKGNIVDGDQIIAMLADRWKRKKILRGGVIGTLMSNYGLENYFKEKKIKFIRANVGDRYVKEKMQKNNFNLGGEQSGHIILSDYSTTGDGLMAALQVLHIIQASGKPASQVCRPFEPRPQLLENVKLNIGDPLRADAVKQVIAESEKRLLGKGRLLIRESGTEPLVRIMAEGEDRKLIASVVNEIVREIERVV